MKHGLRDIQVNLTFLLLLKLNLNLDQKVTCIWHRQSDTMMWWPQNLKECNRESKKLIYDQTIVILIQPREELDIAVAML